MGLVGDMLKGSSSSLSSLGTGVVGSALSGVSSALGSSSASHYARRNMRYQDELQRNFLLDSASLDKMSKLRAGMSPLSSNGTQVAGVNASPVNSDPSLSSGVDSALKKQEIQQQKDVNDSIVSSNNASAENQHAQAEQTKTQTAVFANQLKEQILSGILSKSFVQTNRSHFDRFLGPDGTDFILKGDGIGSLSAFSNIKDLITNKGQGMRYYENFVEGDKGLAHEYNTNPEFQSYLLGKENVSINRENAETNKRNAETNRQNAETNKKQLAIARKQVEASLLSAKAAMRNADANMINAKVADYLKDCQKNGIDSRTAIANVERQSLQIIQSLDRKIALAKEGPQRDKLVRKKQAILNGYRTFNDSMVKWQQTNGSATAFGVVLGGVGSIMSGYGNLMRGISNPVMNGALNPQQPVPTPTPESWLP